MACAPAAASSAPRTSPCRSVAWGIQTSSAPSQAADLTPRRGHGLRLLEHPRVRDEAQEGEQAGPRQADRRAPAQPGVQPIARPRVLRKRADVGVDEQVGIDQDHGNDSPSATEGLGHVVDVTDQATPEIHGLGSKGNAPPGGRGHMLEAFPQGLVDQVLQAWFRVLRNRPILTATSSSRVRVVRIRQSMGLVMS